MRKLIGEMTYIKKTVVALHIGETRLGGLQQLAHDAPDGGRTLSRAGPPIEEMELRVSPKRFARVTCLEKEELLSAISLCQRLRALRFTSSTHFGLEMLQPLRDLAMLSRVNLELHDCEISPALLWKLSGLLQLLPVCQAIALSGPGLAFDLPALSQPHPLQKLSHFPGCEADYPNLVLPPRGLDEAGWGVLKGLKALCVNLDDDDLQRICNSLTGLESLFVEVDSPQNLECISKLSCLTKLSLHYSNECSPGELSALTNLKSLHLSGRFTEGPADLSRAAQLTKLSIYALVPGVDVSVMALTALQTLELGNKIGRELAMDASGEVLPARPQPMDLGSLELNALKHLLRLQLFGCSFSLSSRFLSVYEHPSLQQIYLEYSCPGDSKSLAYFLAMAACVANGGTRLSIATSLHEDCLELQTSEARERTLSLDISYDQVIPSGKLIRFGRFLHATLGSDKLGSRRHYVP